MDLLINNTTTMPSNNVEPLSAEHQFQTNYHYYNLNSQLKFDLEQQNAIKLQQLEAIKLIQISLDKLTATTTVPLHTNVSKLSTTTFQSQPTILVYKETNLHKNLLVSKILNKAKYVYYQSIVQTMRLSLMSKLNYYSQLIQQLNTTSNTASKLSTKLDSSHNNETNLVDEMKIIMQQILHETYQFNLNAPSFNDDLVLPNVTTTQPVCNKDEQLNETDQMKRIKQLNDVKLSLYSLLFSNNNETNTIPHIISDNDDFKSNNKKSDENAKRKRNHHNQDDDVSSNQNDKRHKRYQSIDLNNNHIVILSDDTNCNHRKNNALLKRNKSPQQHISSKLLKTTLDAVVNGTANNSNQTQTQIDSVSVN